jgi:hypothetical protein
MKKKQVGTLFPNNNLLIAYYSPSSFCVTLNTITGQQLKEMAKDRDNFLDKRKLLHHETRYHIDHLSTLWGQQRILELQQAVDARLDKKEAKFTKIVDYKIIENQTHFYSYFTVNEGSSLYKTPADRWIYSVSSGLRFNSKGELQEDKPILFVLFETPDRSGSMRVPLTVASLLEINAMYEETALESEWITRAKEERSRHNTKASFVNKLIKNVIYNQDMIEYNSGVHLLANNLGIPDPHEAFSVASSIATVVLNLPEELLAEIPLTYPHYAVWKDRPQHFINDHNYGFVYFNLLYNYREKYKADQVFNLADFLAINKLPPQQELEQIILDKMTANCASIAPGSYYCEFFKAQLKAGIELFKRRGLDGKRESLKDTFFSGAYVPFILTNDGSFPGKISFDEVYNAKEVPENIDITDWYHLADEINSKMEEFYQVCGV